MTTVGIPQFEKDEVPLISKKQRLWLTLKKPFFFSISFFAFIIIYTQLAGSVAYAPRVTLAITAAAITLWVLEPIPFSMTAILILILLPVSGAASVDHVLAGFASPAVFLILAGMMLANGVEQTSLGKRLAYQLLYWFGEKRGGTLAGVILIPQIMAFFIPATAVRTTMLLPIVFSVISLLGLKKGDMLAKQLMMGVAVGGNISGTAVLPAAIGNVLTVDLINYYLKQHITYLDWLVLSLPIWLIMIPVSWWVLYRTFPVKEGITKGLRDEMKKKIAELGPIKSQEKRTLSILVLVFVMWAMEGVHGLPPVIPTLIGVILMAWPGIKIAKWEDMLNIKLGTLILLGVTLSLGRTLNDTGAVNYLSKWIENDFTLYLFSKPALAVLTVAILTQLIHKVTSNVSTAVIATVPVVIALASQAGQSSSLLLAYVTGITCLFGFSLIVETIPNVLAQETGYISQHDFIKPGLWLTLITTGFTYLMALTWWSWLGYM